MPTSSSLPVVVAGSVEAIQGRVHIAPSACDLVFTARGVLGLTPRLEIEITRHYSAADRLFASAAHFYGDRTIGVVLGGCCRAWSSDDDVPVPVTSTSTS